MICFTLIYSLIASRHFFAGNTVNSTALATMNNFKVVEAKRKFHLALSIAKKYRWDTLTMETLVKPHAIYFGEAYKALTGNGKVLKLMLKMKNNDFKEHYMDIKVAEKDDFLYTEITVAKRYYLLKKSILQRQEHFLEYSELFDQEFNTDLHASISHYTGQELYRFFK